MEEFSYKNEIIYNYTREFTSRIVSETGIPSDKYHLGKIILQSIKNDPDFVMQIDGSTGESETNRSMLRRSIQCATSFREMGLKTGDVIVLMAPNHLDQGVPFYAAMYLGIATAAIDSNSEVALKDTFNICKPKIIFCQSEKVKDVQKAVGLVGLDSTIISFDESPDTTSFSEMMEKVGDQTDADVENFKPADFDPEETIAYLISTSGTTGLPKSAALSHKNMAASGPYICSFANKLPPTRSVLVVAPLQWLTALANYVMSPFFKYTRIQTSHTLTMEHILDLIGKYKPTLMASSPTMMTTLLKEAKIKNCDFSCFEVLYLGGSAVPRTLVEELKIMAPKAIVGDAFGMSEIGSLVFHTVTTLGSCGKPFAHMQYKLVNTKTGEEIKEPNKSGELWVKAPGGFKGYYNDPEATAEVLSKDDWLMTGDMMYRDENWNFYFTERIKLLLKYKSHHLSPVEVEAVIHQHPGVLDVAVTSLPDSECGDLPVACVIPRPGADVTAEEIKDLVKENLTDSKQLRGGVFFFKEFPLTSSTKVHRRKLKEIVIARTREQESQNSFDI